MKRNKVLTQGKTSKNFTNVRIGQEMNHKRPHGSYDSVYMKCPYGQINVERK